MSAERLELLQNRMADLKAMLKARDGKTEYHDNVKAIRAEIERVEKELNDGE